MKEQYTKYIENYMDLIYTEYIENHPESDFSKITMVISKQDFEFLQQTYRDLAQYRPDAELISYVTHCAPWGFGLIPSEKLATPECHIFEL